LGRKSGEGFYRYSDGKKVFAGDTKEYTAPADITDRMMLRFLNEAVTCLREGIVDNADLLDGGVIFGTGFAPFRGGPMNYIEKTGTASLRQTLEVLEQKYGSRFIADAGWSGSA